MRISDWSSDVCSSDLPGHIRRLALIRRHTQRRVALEMFDRAEILARGELHVARGHIVLEVDPSRPRARIAVGEMQRRSDRHRERRLNIVALPRRAAAGERRSEERSAGTACVSTCRSRGAPYPQQKQSSYKHIKLP